MFDDAPQRTWRNLVREVARYGHTSRFAPMFVLTMTSPCGNKVPAVILNQPDNLSDFHRIKSGSLVRPQIAHMIISEKHAHYKKCPTRKRANNVEDANNSS